jgi:hypothetical protein
MGITHLLDITLCIKLLDEVLVELNGTNYIGKLMQPLGGSMHFIRSNGATNVTCDVTCSSKFDPNSLEDVDDVNGWNCIPCFINPLTLLMFGISTSFEVHNTSMMLAKLIALDTPN